MKNNSKRKIIISVITILVLICMIMPIMILHNRVGVLSNIITQDNSKMAELNMHEVEFSEIATGNQESIAIDKNGNLWCWGYQILGYEKIEITDYPVKLKIQGQFQKISMSERNRLAIDINGNIWSWGDNSYGQLGDNTTKEKNIDEAVIIKPDTKFKEISVGSGYSLAIDEDGNLWSWGNNRNSQLGDGTTIDSKEPIQIKEGTEFDKIAAGRYSNLAIDKEGNLWKWGYGITEPTQIGESTKFKEISSSEFFSLAIDKTGNLWSWGDNYYGQLGDGTTTSSKEPKKITNNTKFKKISAGYGYSLAIDEAGNLWGWGDNSNGQLGDGTTTNTTKPKQITTDKKFVNIQTGNDSFNTNIYSLALDENGKIWSWGNNINGQLGNEKASSYSTEMLLLNKSNHYVKVSTNYSHSLAIDKAGNLWAWGYNYWGQLGDGTTIDSEVPKQIMPGTQFKEIEAGENYSLAIDKAGNLWAWGMNNSGQLGDGTNTNSKDPKQIIKGTKFTKITTGRANSYAIDEQGNLWGWGENSEGQIGIGKDSKSDDDYIFKPTKINEGVKYKEISADTFSVLAIDREGNVWAWGNSVTLLKKYIVRSNVPINLNLDIKFDTLSKGRGLFAIDVDGNVWKWLEDDGESKIPTQITTGTKFKKISCGFLDVNSYIALDEEGNIWTWGDENKNGQLGNGTTNNIDKPTKLENITLIVDISMGFKYCEAIDEEGNLWAWGDNGTLQYNRKTKILGNPAFSNITTAQVTQFSKDTKFVYANGENFIDEEGNLWYGSRVINIPSNEIKYSKASNHLILDQEGNLYAKGRNNYGQLGDGTNTDSNVPKPIKSNTKFKEISASTNHSLAIDTLGNLWAWGYNYDGQLGDGTNTNSNIPKQIKSNTKFSKIYAGNDYSLAIDTSGNLWAWGNNYYGQLGDGTTRTKYNEPKQIMANMKFKEIYAGDRYSLMIDTSGNLWGSGSLGRGSVKDETTQTTAIPIQILSGTKFNKVNGLMALDVNGKIWTAMSMNGGGNSQPTSVSKLVESDATFVDINVADGRSAIDSNGGLWLWGNLPTILYRQKYYTEPQKITVMDYSYEVKFMDGTQTLKTQYVSEGKSATAPEVPKKEGYTFTGWDKPFNNVTSDLIVNATWERNTFTVTFKDGTERTETQTVNSGEPATPPNWTKPGYDLSWSEDITNITSDLEVEAIWTARTDTPYTVEHHLQNLNSTTYTKDNTATEEKTGITNTQTNAVAKTYTGFTVQPFEQKIIRGEGDTVVIIYYNRNKYTIILDPGEGTLPAGSEEIEYTYGEEKELPVPTRPGYDFDGWYDDEGNKVDKITPTDNGDKELEAKWNPRTDTPYKVIHHFRNLDTEVEGFIDEEEPLTGTTGTQVTAQYKDREGFTKNEADARTVKQGTVAGDGSLVLHLYYTRNTYNIEYELNGGTVTSPLTNSYTYGKEMILQTNRVIREGYEFAGWYDNEELLGSPVTSISDTSIGDKTFYAKWTKNIFTVTFKDGTERTDVQTINRGQNATAPNWTKPGYDLSWSKDITNITSDLEVEAIWTPRNDTAYKVIHHFRNLDTEVEGYIDEEEQKIGTTDTQVTAEYKEREGFTKNEADTRTVKQGTVAGNGSLVLHLYYTRNTYNITYVLNGGTIISSLTNKYIYGKEMILQTNRVTKQGYTFAGWYDNEELLGSPVTSISATSIGDKTFYAKWVDVEQEYYILSEVYNIDLTENIITKVSPETSVAEFLTKIETNGVCKVLNLKGEEVTGNALVGTGYKLQVTFKEETYTYEIAVRGDLDGNGKITTTDLSIINQQILHKIELTGIKAKAADIDYNGRLTTTDLSMINQAVLRKITL